MISLAKKSLQELRDLTITQVQWQSNATLGFTLNDGQTCKAGSYDFDKSYTVDPDKNITSIQVIIKKNESGIVQINFYSGEERLVKVGCDDDDYVEEDERRKETFEIAADEQLIGCELSYDNHYFQGVTWIKMKVPSLGEKR